MKILIIDEWFPYPMDSGKKIRTYNLMSYLAGNNDITYICFHRDADKLNLGSLTEKIETTPISDKRVAKGSLIFYLKVFLNIFRQAPFSASYSYVKEMKLKLEEHLRNSKFDLIICEWTPYAHYLENIDHTYKILMAHNVEFQQWQRMFEVTHNPLKRILFKKQWRSMYAFEKRYFKTFNAIITVSSHDKLTVEKMSGHKKVYVVENGVDLDYFKPLNMARKNYVAYTASMDAFVNQNAALYFAKNIFPRLRQKNPTMDYYIVGRAPNKEILDLGKHEGIVVTGTVDDVRPYLAQSSVAIAPILAGGGSRLKILEAMALGIPVVATSVGAEGLEVENGKHILITDSEEEFAEYIIRCHDDSVLRSKLTSNALELVKNKYSWEYLGKKLNNYLEEITNH